MCGCAGLPCACGDMRKKGRGDKPLLAGGLPESCTCSALFPKSDCASGNPNGSFEAQQKTACLVVQLLQRRSLSEAAVSQSSAIIEKLAVKLLFSVLSFSGFCCLLCCFCCACCSLH